MKNSDLVVTTTAQAKPGKEKIVQQALCDVAKAARIQPGCIEYSILRSTENPAVTVNFERWASKAERDTFLAGADVKKFASAVSRTFVMMAYMESITSIGFCKKAMKMNR